MDLNFAPKGWEEKFPRQWAIAGAVMLLASLGFVLVWLQTRETWSSWASILCVVLGVGFLIKAFLYRVLARRPPR